MKSEITKKKTHVMLRIIKTFAYTVHISPTSCMRASVMKARPGKTKRLAE